MIAPSDRVVCILTGHQLKDPTATVAYHSTDQDQFDQVLGSRGRAPGGFREPARRGRQRPRRHHPHDRPLLGNRVAAGILNKERANVSRPILSIGIHGASGRMGTRLIQLIAEDPGLKLAAALVREGHPEIGRDAGTSGGHRRDGGLAVLVASGRGGGRRDDRLLAAAGCRRRHGVLPLRGRFRWSSARPASARPQRSELEKAAAQIPILIAPNMSRAVNLLMKLVGEAARSLGSSADIAIIERHHKTKKDAPSGTALRLAECAGRGNADALPGSYPAMPARKTWPGPVKSRSTRSGSPIVPASTPLIFGLPGETMELSHRALNRDGFVRGALDCAKFLAGKTGRSVHHGRCARVLNRWTLIGRLSEVIRDVRLL